MLFIRKLAELFLLGQVNARGSQKPRRKKRSVIQSQTFACASLPSSETLESRALLTGAFTGITPDNGEFANDEVTNVTNVALQGTNTPGQAVTIEQISDPNGTFSSPTLVAFLNGAAVSGSTFSVNVDLTAGDGIYGFQIFQPGQTTPDTLSVTIDTVAPTVALSAPSLTNDNTPEITVDASDAATGINNGTTAFLDIDLTGDNDFDDVGESSYATGTVSSGTAKFSPTTSLLDGSYKARARVADLAGNIGTSTSSTIQVDTTPPTITAGNIATTGSTGTNTTFKIGDTVTVAWDNTVTGNNNSDVDTVTINFSQFGGNAATPATNAAGTWSATYVITSGNIDSTTTHASVTATDFATNSSTTADSDVSVDNQAPTVTDGNISVTSTGSGTTGEYIVGDTITVEWDNTASGDNNADTISGVTVNFSAFGGGAAVAATDKAGVWSASYVVAAGTVDATGLNASVTATDDAGNAKTTADTTGLSADNEVPVVTDGHISITSTPTGSNSTYIVGDTITVEWDSTASGDDNADIASVTVDFSAFGGSASKAANNSSGKWSASYTLVAGTLDATGLNAAVTATDDAGQFTTTGDTTGVSADNQAPTVTDANISVTSTGSGPTGEYIVGDTITIEWDNTLTGDDNADIAGVTVDFSAFGGGAAVAATNASGIWSASYVVAAGSVDATGLNAAVTATDDAGQFTTTGDTTGLSADNQAPTVTDGNISVTSTGSGTTGEYIVGDTITVEWDNTSSGDNNADIAGVTINLSAFGGGAAVAATNNAGVWSASYTLMAGTLDATGLNAAVTATDDVGQFTTTGDTTGLSADNEVPVVTDGHISITSSPTGNNSTYIVGDTITVEWDNTLTGDDNADIAGVTVDFSAFGGAAAVAATNNAGIWSASYVVAAGSVDATGLNAAVTATDDAGQFTTTGDTTGLSADNQAPTVTDGNISVTSTGSGPTGEYIVGDTITIEWDNTASGDNNADTISGVTVNFSAFGGGAAVAATDKAGVWSASYVVAAGTVDATGLNASVTATDDAGNAKTTADTTGLSADNEVPVVTDGHISITSTPTGSNSTYIVGDTITVEWDSTASGDDNADIASVTVDFSAFGGSASKAANNSSGKWSASYTLVAGTLDATGLNAAVTATDDAGQFTTTGDTTGVSADNQAPTVTDANISVTSTGSGPTGEYIVGDTITIEWDNTLTGDDNADIAGVTVDFSAFGGGAAVAATNASGIWSASYVVAAGSVDATGLNAAVTATDDAGQFTTTGDTTGLSADNQAPTVTDGNISVTSTGSGTTGEYIVGDTITVEWDNTSSGDNNADIAGVTINLSAFGGGAAVAATNNAGVWSASYTLMAGTLDATGLNAAVTATDDVGQFTTTGDTTGLSADNEVPVVTDGHISITSSPTGNNSTYIVGDTITVEWDNTLTGDDNADIAGVTVDFSAFGGAAAVAATNNAGIWSASYVVAAGSVDATGLNAAVTATDDAGQFTTTGDTTGLSADNQAPTVTDGNISVTSTGSGPTGEYIVGDTITIEWDNTASGDNNADTISGVTVNFSAFGGGAAVAATDKAGVWSASYVLLEGSGATVIDATGLNAAVTATDNAGNITTTPDTTGLTGDNDTPIVTDDSISVLTSGTGTSGEFIAGDTITIEWDNTASGDNNADIADVSIDFSAFGGGIQSATNSSGKWTASYTVLTGSIDATNLNAEVTATDDAGNFASATDTSNLSVDNTEPIVTTGNISVTGASGTGGAFKAGDTVTVTWDNTITGDNNTDIESVTVDFSDFGGGTAVIATNSSGVWTASFLFEEGTVDASNATVEVTATDDAGNVTSTTDDSSFQADNQLPVVSITAAPTITNDNTPTITVNVTDGGSAVANGTVVFIDVDLNDDGDYDDTSETAYAQGTTTSGDANITLSTLADGPYSIRARSTDDAGNVNRDATSFIIDTTAPDVTINGAPTGNINEGDSVSLTTKVLDLTKVTYSWSVGSPSTNKGTSSSGFDFTVQDDGTYKAQVVVTDEAGNQTTEFVDITVDNVAPTAVNDPASGSEAKYTTNENSILTVVTADGVLANDTDPAGVNDPLSVSAVDGNTLGKTSVTVETGNGATVVMFDDGSFTYDPSGSFVAQTLGVGESLNDTFEYEVSDDDGGSNTATVTVTVTGVNDAPQILDGSSNPVTANGSIVTLTGLDANDGTGTAGDLIQDFFSDRIFDIDASSVNGIAIVSATVGATGGTWEYQLAGSSTWTAFGSVSASNALHLDAAARVRLKLPSIGGSQGSPSFTWRAWDKTNSPAVASGGRASVTAIGTGGTTPYSAFSAVGRVSVSAAANDAPTTIGSIANQNTAEDSPFSLTVSSATLFADQDAGDTINLSATLVGGASLPSWLTFNGTTGKFSGTPNDADVGSIQVRVTGTDSGGLSASTTFLLTVTATNDAPVNTVPATLTIAEDTTSVAILGLSLTDADAGSSNVVVTLSVTSGTLSLSTGISNGLISSQVTGNNSDSVTITAPISKINTTLAAATGLSFAPLTNFNGNVTLTIASNDQGNSGAGGNLTDSDSFTIAVTAVNDAPVISGPETVDITIPENATGIDTIVVVEVDGDKLSYSLTGADATKFQLDGSNFLSFISAPDFDIAGDANGDNVYEVTVSVSDGHGGSDSQSFAITISEVNDNNPVVTSSSTFTIDENKTSVGTVTATDADQPSQKLSFSVSGGVDADFFSIDADGQLSFKAAPNYEGFDNDAEDNDYEVDVTVSDGVGGSTIQSIVVTVADVNEPVVEANGIADQQIDELVPFNLSVPSDAFSDPDEGDTLTYSATLADNSPLPMWLTFSSGSFSGTPGYDDVGTISVKVTATDTDSHSASTTFDITVNQVLVEVDVTLGNTPNDVVVKVVGGNLVIQTTSNTDLITPLPASRVISVTINGGTDTDNITIDGSVNGTLTNAQAVPFILHGNAGNDSLNASAINYQTQLNGGDGNDTLYGGLDDDSLSGGDGIDTAVATGDTNFVITDSLISGTGTDLLSSIESASIIGGGGNNKLDASAATIPVVLNGGGGNDSLLGGSSTDVLFGGIGDDTLRGGAGEDSLQGLSGNDLLEGGDGNDTLLGGTDIDRFELNTALNVIFSNAQVQVKSGTTLVEADILSGIEQATLNLSPGRNLVDGSAFSGLGATILGGGGTDAIIGTQGDDFIQTGSGNDVLDGLTGNDTIYSSGGNDAIRGGDGNDVLAGNAGNDSIDGGAGVDAIFGNDGADILQGGLGNDAIQGGTGANQIFGGDGNDLLLGGINGETIDGESGDDRIFGLSGNDLVRGGDGNDSLLGDAGNDTLEGGAGNDTLTGNIGLDSIDGGADFDRVVELSDGDVTIVGTQVQSTSLGTETHANIERINLSGTASNNRFDARQSSVRVLLIGDGGNDTLFGGALNDTILGGEGNDVISGGAGNDSLDGGNGIDVHYEKADANFTVVGTQVSSPAIGTDAVTSIEGIALVGGASANLINASQASVNVVLLGGGGNDTLIGGAQADTLSGGSRNDDTAPGADGVDSIDGGDGADTIESDSADNIVVDINDQQLADIFGLLPDWLDQ